MADTKISALTAAAVALGTHEIPVNDAGASKKVTLAQLVTYLATLGINANTVMKVKASDESVNSAGTGTTLQDDNDLFFPIGASEKWVAEGMIFVTTPAAADFKMAFTIPTGATMQWAAIFQVGTTSQDVLQGTVSGTADSTLIVLSSAPAYLVVSVINSTTAGNVKMQFAQNTADAGNTTVLAGSFLVAHKV